VMWIELAWALVVTGMKLLGPYCQGGVRLSGQRIKLPTRDRGYFP
jgi:hypothetical protein